MKISNRVLNFLLVVSVILSFTWLPASLIERNLTSRNSTVSQTFFSLVTYTSFVYLIMVGWFWQSIRTSKKFVKITLNHKRPDKEMLGIRMAFLWFTTVWPELIQE